MKKREEEREKKTGSFWHQSDTGRTPRWRHCVDPFDLWKNPKRNAFREKRGSREYKKREILEVARRTLENTDHTHQPSTADPRGQSRSQPEGHYEGGDTSSGFIASSTPNETRIPFCASEMSLQPQASGGDMAPCVTR